MKKTLIALLMGLMLAGCGATAEKDAAVGEEKAVETSEEERFEVITVDGPKELTAEEIVMIRDADIEYAKFLHHELEKSYRLAELYSEEDQLLLEFEDLPKASTRTRDATYAIGEEYKQTIEGSLKNTVVDYKVTDGRRLYITIEMATNLKEYDMAIYITRGSDLPKQFVESFGEYAASTSSELRTLAAKRGFDLDCLVKVQANGVAMTAARNGYTFYDIRDEEVGSAYILDYKELAE